MMKRPGKQILQRLAALFPLLALVLVLPAREKPEETFEFSGILGKNCELFRTAEPETFLRRSEDNPCSRLFRWTSTKKTDARCDTRGTGTLSLFGVPVCEMIFRFENGKPVNLYTSYYNRGDCGELLEHQFQNLLGKIAGKLTEFTGDKGVEKTGKLSGDDKIFRNIRLKGDFVFELRWSTRRQKGWRSCEYIQLEIYPFNPKHDPRKTEAARFSLSGSRKSLAENIVRNNESGDVYLDNIPMVDQGSKGYCVPATVERVLRYYGNTDVSQHVLAQAAESDSKHGTDLSGMVEEVKRIGVKLGVKTRMLYQRYRSVKEFDKFLKKYNKKARRMKFPKVDPVIRDNIYYFTETISRMEPDVYLETWADEKKDFRKFQKDVHTQLEKGIPVLWSIKTGLYPEENNSAADGPGENIGAHVRLIIGYNDKTKSILFSDSWGAGHEKKSMPENQAWAITDTAFILTPRK